jgi:predicted AlkP superfamily pyrophosphatase or phosphodiesterase
MRKELRTVESKANVVFVIVDGMRNDTAQEMCGYLEGLIEHERGLRARVESVLPSLSRPCYEAIFTGTTPHVNGITCNEIIRKSSQVSLFDQLRKHDLTSVVAGYYWLSELYHRAPFDRIEDREQNNNCTGITYGRYYFEDTYPDSHLYAEAEGIRRKARPNLVVIHSMNVDDAGHRYGGLSKEYRAHVARVDTILSMLMPVWMDEGYDVIVTADHGMDEHGFHGGTKECERITPLYLFSTRLKQFGRQDAIVPQTSLAHLLCQLLGIEKADTMGQFPDELARLWFESVETGGMFK